MWRWGLYLLINCFQSLPAAGVEVGAYQHGCAVYYLPYQDQEVEEAGCLLADWRGDFCAGSEDEPDLVCADDGVVNQGVPLTGLEVLDGFVS